MQDATLLCIMIYTHLGVADAAKSLLALKSTISGTFTRLTRMSRITVALAYDETDPLFEQSFR